MAKSRWAEAPEAPTSNEGAVIGLYASFWRGLWAPKGTSPNVNAKLDDAVVESLADPAVHQRFIELGQELWRRDKQTPEARGPTKSRDRKMVADHQGGGDAHFLSLKCWENWSATPRRR